jgi:hypothetical protein
MPVYSVSCRGRLSGGAIVHLRQAGMYRDGASEGEVDRFDPSGAPRHQLVVEASSAEDAILIVRGALAVSGAEATDYSAEEAPADA